MTEATISGGDCLFGLVVGEPHIDLDTFLGCDPVQRHPFAGISSQVKPMVSSTPYSSSSPSPTDDWTTRQLKQKGLSSKRARDFANVLLQCLPAEEQARRRQRAAAEAWLTRERLLEDYEGLSQAAKDAFDGKPPSALARVSCLEINSAVVFKAITSQMMIDCAFCSLWATPIWRRQSRSASSSRRTAPRAPSRLGGTERFRSEQLPKLSRSMASGCLCLS